MAQAANPAAKPSTASTGDRMRDSLGGAVATLRDLFSDGAFEVITPPTRDSNAPIDAKTLVQIDGDVVTLIRETAPATALDNHFVRVRRRLDALDRLRRTVLAALYVPIAGVGLWQGGATIQGAFDPAQTVWQVIWPHGVWVILAIIAGIAGPWLTGKVLHLLIGLGRKRFL